MRRVVLVCAIVLAGASPAWAGLRDDAQQTWDADLSNIASAFYVDGSVAAADVDRVSDGLELTSTDYPIDGESLAWLAPVDHLLPGTLAAEDRALCRYAALNSLVMHRQS